MKKPNIKFMIFQIHVMIYTIQDDSFFFSSIQTFNFIYIHLDSFDDLDAVGSTGRSDGTKRFDSTSTGGTVGSAGENDNFVVNIAACPTFLKCFFPEIKYKEIYKTCAI